MASSSSPPPPHTPRSPFFTSIPENEHEDEEEAAATAETKNSTPSVEKTIPYKHHPTPLHVSSSRRPSEASDDDRSVSCNKCRPNSREKISVVPLDVNGSKRPSSHLSPSPNGIFKALFSSLTRKSSKSPATGADSSAASPATGREEQWKLAVAELSQKLLQATRRRDEALSEASRLKHSMAELEKKLNKLEIYCHDLKSGLEVCNSSPSKFAGDKKNITPATKFRGIENYNVIESFLGAVSDARSAVRNLSRCLTLQLRQIGGKVCERISLLLQPYEVGFSVSKNPRRLLFYLEALLNRAFYEDFEGIGFQKNGSDPILNPIERCESNFTSYSVLKDLSWDEVLTKGTRHFSENFSRFCDRKMSEIVGMLSWSRAWPEPLLQSFFGAAKSVWLVHLLAFSVHPGFVIFRVEKGATFEGVYMEDMVADKARKLAPATVRIMVAPGFYVYNNVVKCKVLCRYNQVSHTSP